MPGGAGRGVGAGSATIDLRYLGTNRTLVLVDGLRFVNATDANGNLIAQGAKPENALTGQLFGPDGTGEFGGALDIPAIQGLIQHWADQKLMLPRTSGELYEMTRDFQVAEAASATPLSERDQPDEVDFLFRGRRLK